MTRFCIILPILLLPLLSFTQKRKVIKELKAMEVKLKHHAGLYVYDPEQEKVLIDYKGDKYFTPASNTKIFTLYTSLNVLGDSIPGVYYRETPDSLIIWGSGDPSIYYEEAPNSDVPDWIMAKNKTVYLSDQHFQDEHFGAGWSWDDYGYSYQVEKAALPLFGNYYYISKKSGKLSLQITNDFFKPYFNVKDSLEDFAPVLRQYGSNTADYYPREEEEEFSRLIPYRYSNPIAASMLGDTLGLKVIPSKIPLDPNYRVKLSVPTDSLYKVLMQASDNFIAEQLMLTVSGMVSDTLNTAIGIKFSKENFLNDLPDEPLWFDGSGLSRYNQFTPRSIVRLWEKILNEFDRDRIFPLLAIGGETGTIRNFYSAEKPYIFGKTGTLRNHHCLSGYLLTDSGKTLIFSFMNGHYPGSSGSVKKEMERILLMLKDRY